MANDGVRVSAIALDMIGVLVQEERLISVGFPAYFGDRLRLPIEQIKERYDHGYSVGALSQDEFWEGILDEDWRAPEVEFLSSRAFAPDAAGVLSELQTAYRLAVISDMPREWAAKILELHGVLDRFQCGVYSNDGSGSKKDGRLFRALLDTLGLPGQEVLLVDDRQLNLDSAKEIGIRGAWLPLPGSSDHDPTNYDQIESLTDLPGLLTTYCPPS